MDASMKRGALQKVSWNAIITGFFCSIATQITLGLFGAALGFLGGAGGAGWGFIGAIWGILVPVVAGFVGAYVATRIAVADSMVSAEMHGVLVWCLGLLAGALFFAFSMMGFGASALGLLSGSEASSAAGAGAGSFALAGLSALLGLGGAIWGAAVGRRALGETAMLRGERHGRERPDLGPPVNPTDVTGTIPPRTGDHYPSNPPGERH